MSDRLSKEFFTIYHAAVFEALGDDAQKYNVKIGITLANHLLKNLAKHPENEEEFKNIIESYFKSSFQFSDIADMKFGGDGSASLYVKGCDICPGNEILRGMGKKGMCPIAHLVKSIMARTLKKHVELLGSDKPGPIGECYLKYKVG
ncbi:MAG: hypothetical protein A2073_05070 [Deltaproteobacteria bacterium GWC2_42_11]|nr:MAG: hypothetical protein A2073_05070 [Deltaproteobacteria bacterium GWC2_42_11]HBO84287.1 hypothetical protein [Deltaproteobacteria bacterium]